MSKFAWVTLTTNDTYSLGALVLAHSLRRAGTVHQLAVLVTPGVSESMRQKLKDAYNLVQEVNVMDSQDAANLALLARPELGITFTKLHCWRLVQFEKCVFLDADTLVLQNCDELFEREEFSAAPDVSWPDCFNSGVFVYQPNMETFDKIVAFALKNGSFDGGDQGLLNQYFADWATSDIKKRLPFLYNVTAYASYCYLPAFKQFRDKIKILHFAGKLKPWLIHYNTQSKSASVPTDYSHASDLIQLWWNIFFDKVHGNLNTEMLPLVQDDNKMVIEQDSNGKKGESNICPTMMTWLYNYNVMQQQHHHNQHNQQYQQQQQPQPQQQQEQRYHDHNRNRNNQYFSIEFPYQEEFDSLYSEEKVEFHDPWEDFYKRREMEIEFKEDNRNIEHNAGNEFTQEQCANLDNIDAIDIYSCDSTNTDVCSFADNTSGYNTAIKCQVALMGADESTDDASTTCSISFDSNNSFDTISQATINNDESLNDYLKHEEAGLAGALSQLRLGEPASHEQSEYEQMMRRQCWEHGQVDYLGRDSFDNIWKKISQTLEDKPSADKAESNSNQRKLENNLTANAPMLTSADIEDGKVEYDQKTGVKVEYHKIDGGYQVKTTTPQPGGGWKSATQTFYDPKPVSEEDMKKQMANKKIVMSRMNKEIRIDSKTTMLTREIEGGYEEVYTTVNDDGTKSVKTKTFFDPIPEGQSFPDHANKPVAQKPGNKKTVTRKSSVESTDSTDSRKIVQKTNKNQTSTVEESRRVTQNMEYTENNRTVRKNSLQTEQTMKSVTSSNVTDGNNKKKVTKKTKTQAPPPPADFVQNDTTTVSTKRVPGGMEYTYSTQLESGKTITTSKTVYEEEETECTEQEIREYQKALKDAEKHKNVTTTKKLRSESGTKKVVPSENPGDVTTVETIKIKGGTEYHYTTVTASGVVKKAIKTVYDPVPSSNPDDSEEEEIIEEYEEEIIEPGAKNVKTIETIKQLPQKFQEEVTFTSEKKEKKVKKTMTMVSH